MRDTFQTISPIDGSLYVERQIASDKEIERTLTLARKAQLEWKKTSLDKRAIICQKAVSYFVQYADEIGQELTWQMGRPIRYTPFEIKLGFQERAEHMIAIAGDALADTRIPQVPGFQRFIRQEPLGLVFVLAPWNYPYLTSVNAIIPALMSGNAVILKHAQQTPLCAERYAQAFEFAGLPEGVFQYLHLTHHQVANVIGDNRISYVAFTGSVAGGKAIQRSVGQRFISTGLELGGKDPAYVRADANLQDAAENLVDGSFFNSGQSCCAVERIYVHEKLLDSFLDLFIAQANDYNLSNPLLTETTLGPMVKTSAADHAQKQINQALQLGARSLIDQTRFPNHQEGTPYMAPQILVDVNHSMEIMQEETFAPVACIMSVKNDAEAIQLMNDSKYGLTASIWTRDIERALEIGDQLETGTCYMNRCDYLDPALAWTGVKDSGKGVTLSQFGYNVLTRPKSFHFKITE